MKATTLLLLSAMTVVICPAMGFGDEPVPDLKGNWVGKTYSIVAGSGGHWPTSAGTFEKPGLYQKDLVIEVTNQVDRRLWGMQTLSGGGEKTQEPFIAELTGKDNRHVVLVDTDGYFDGEVDGDTLSFCYKQAGATHEGKTSSVISCSELHHQH